MANPLFNQLNNSGNNNILQMVQQFNQFKNSFQGDAKAEVQNLLNSGKMTQEMYNKLQNTATIFSKFLK